MNSERVQSRTKVTRWDLWKVFIASFFMQSVWNFRSLLSIGFSICLFPVLDKLCADAKAKRQFFKRHLKFFNAHPYFASFALGVSIRLEEMRAEGYTEIPETLVRIKDMLIGPLGAVGDRLFWATIKPASLILGMLGVLIAPTLTWKIGTLIFIFLLYNIPHFYLRYRGILEGYNKPMEIYQYVGQQRFELLRKVYIFVFAASLVGLFIAYNVYLYHILPGLIPVFIVSAVFAFVFNRLVNNFYLVSFSTLILFIVVGLLFF